MSFTGKRPTFNTAALVPSATAPANPITGDMYLNDGSGSIEGGLYRYNGSQFVRIDVREKNLVINGGMDFWQRGTSFTASGVYTADRFKFDHSTASITETLSRSTDVPVTSANYSLDVAATVGGSVGAAEFTLVRHFIEGYNIRELAGKPFVLSFWVKATVTGQHALSFANAGSDRYFATSYTVNTTNTWEKKYVRVPAFDVTSGTWNITTGRGLTIAFAPASGTSRLTAASTTWDTGTSDGTTGSVNALATTGNILRIANLMLTAGEDHKEDFHRAAHSIADELLLCHRYYYKSYDIATNPGTVTNLGSEDLFITEFTSVAGRSTRKSVQFATHMRSAPTITTYDLNAGTSGNWRSISGNSASTVSEIGQSRARISVTDGGAASTSMLWQGHFTADAEIG